MIVSDIIAKCMKKEGIKDIFMLTGYGAMYLNDSIEKEGINYIAARSIYLIFIITKSYFFKCYFTYLVTNGSFYIVAKIYGK